MLTRIGPSFSRSTPRSKGTFRTQGGMGSVAHSCGHLPFEVETLWNPLHRVGGWQAQRQNTCVPANAARKWAAVEASHSGCLHSRLPTLPKCALCVVDVDCLTLDRRPCVCLLIDGRMHPCRSSVWLARSTCAFGFSTKLESTTRWHWL